MAEVMLTKLMPPREDRNLLPRERLIEPVLNADKTRIIIITAPAGYGKTILTLQLSHKLERPLVWFHLDRNDNDPALFLQYLTKGLQSHWPNIGDKVLQLTMSGEKLRKMPRFIASLLINDFVRTDANPLIVLDDYHVIKEPVVHSIAQEFIEHLPPEVFLIIASRNLIPLSLSRLYVNKSAIQISTGELCFTQEEAGAVISKLYGAQSGKTVEKIHGLTGGWPAIMELVNPKLIDSIPVNFKDNSPMSGLLYDYLASEILEKLPSIYQKFLIESSVLKVLNPEECDLLLERTDSEKILQSLAEKFLLLTPLVGVKSTYRCHQLFRKFLMDRLINKKNHLFHRAGRIARWKNQTGKAVEYYLQSDFDEEAKAVLEEAGRLNLLNGRWHTVANWLEQLSDDQVRNSAWLSFYKAVIETYRGRLDQAEQWIEIATSMFTVDTENTGLAECRLLQARLLRHRGLYSDSMTLLDQVSAWLNTEETAQRYDLILEKAYNLTLSGNLKEAETYLTDSLKLSKQAGNMVACTHMAEALGHILYQQGQHSKALQIYQWGIKNSTEGTLPGYYTQDAVPYIYCDWGEMDKALEWALKSVEVKERYQLVETLPSAYCALSYIYYEIGDFEKTEELITKALELQYHYGSERYFLLLNKMLLSWCRFARGNWVESKQILDETIKAAEIQNDLACGLVQMLAGTILALMGNIPEAKAILMRAEFNLSAMNFRTRLCQAYKAIAYIHYYSGEQKEFEKYARKFLSLGAKLNFICNALQPTAKLLEPILRFSLENDIETTYTQQMLIRLGKLSLNLLYELSEHPNPAVRHRVIAPLTELSGEDALKIITILSRDNAPVVRQSAQSYLHYMQLPSKMGLTNPRVKFDEKPEIEVKTFGSFQLYRGEKEITGWRTRKTCELLALMLHLERPACKERLIEELWPETDPQNGSALFRTTMHYLRRHFECKDLPDLVFFKQDCYALQSGLFQLDFKNFEGLINAGLQEEPLRELSVGMLSKAVQIYRGDYLAEQIEYAWAIPRQVRLRHLYFEALLALARFYRLRGSYHKAMDYLLKLKEADPLCEPAHRLLLQIYSALGDRQAFTEEQKWFKTTLLEESGLTPSPETEKLYQKLGCFS
ncbi:MAG: BTAD domain-containing putative transcriptional regulator [Bacillota bacterium]|nr:BTAD domain-containing putative transcriptional regulator [Bacillota bacterium]